MKQIAHLTKSYQKDVALWTGYSIEELNKSQLDALEDVDYIIDGPYIQDLSDPYHLKWKGSKNQRIMHHIGGEFINIG